MDMEDFRRDLLLELLGESYASQIEQVVEICRATDVERETYGKAMDEKSITKQEYAQLVRMLDFRDYRKITRIIGRENYMLAFEKPGVPQYKLI